MAFRFDMQGKTPQQQIIVSKRDDEEKRRKQETAKRDAEKSIVADLSTHFIALAIDKDTCPDQDNIIMKQQCSGCKYYKDFTMCNGQACVRCTYDLTSEKEL